MTGPVIAVTGMNAHDNPGPGVAVIRGIRQRYGQDCRIIGLAYDALEPGVFLGDLVDEAFLIPYPSEGETAFWTRMMQIHETCDLDVLLPTLDAELPIILGLEQKLHEQGIKTFLPSRASLEQISKSRFHKLRKDYGINVPESDVATDTSRLDALCRKFGFPVMIKGQYYEAYIAHNTQEAILYFSKIRDRWGLPIIVQQYILGEEYDVVALGDGNGDTVGLVPMRKMYLTDKGKAWAGITVTDPKLLDLAYQVISKLEWQGPMELEIMRRRADGELFLLEVNPRFPAWVYLAVGSGVNLPAATVALALGEEISPMPDFEVGKIFVRTSMDMITDLEKFESITTLGHLSHTPKENTK